MALAKVKFSNIIFQNELNEINESIEDINNFSHYYEVRIIYCFENVLHTCTWIRFFLSEPEGEVLRSSRGSKTSSRACAPQESGCDRARATVLRSATRSAESEEYCLPSLW